VITLTIPEGETHVAEVTAGAFDLAAGTPLYAFISQAGGHGDIQLSIRTETA
jgi:hypothetical protein